MAFQLQVRTPRTLTVNDLHADDDVNVLLAAVERKSHTPLTLSWLAFEGRKLEPGRSLAQYGLRNGATVHLAVRGLGGGCGGSKQVQNESISTSPAGIPPPRQTQQPLAAGSSIAHKEEKAAPSAEDEPMTTAVAVRVEVERVMALPEEELALVGKAYTDPELLWAALAPLLILRASWVKCQCNGRLPKRGDPLPPEAVISVDELRAIAKASRCSYHTVPLIALSHFWRTKEHPDPDGETLELVITALEHRWHEFTCKGVTDLGLIIDYCALYQAPRTPEQEVFFSKGLVRVRWAFTHPPSACAEVCVCVCLLVSLVRARAYREESTCGTRTSS